MMKMDKEDEILEQLRQVNNRLDNLDEKIENKEQVQKIERKTNNKITCENIKEEIQKPVDIDPQRLISLNDGIFRLVMTLLAVGITLPEIPITTNLQFVGFAKSLLPNVGIVAVSFIILSTFWMAHHQYIKIRKLNTPFLWLNLIHLALITFIPFTISIIGNYSSFFLANVIYGINILLTIITFLLILDYGYKHELIEPTSMNKRRYITRTFIIIMLLTMAINILDFKTSHYFIYLYLALPFIMAIREAVYNIQYKKVDFE